MDIDPTQDTIRIVRKSPPKPQQSSSLHSTQGLDFCFLMDITQSMQKYVDGTMKSLQQLMKQIQQMFTNQVKIGFFGYRDFEKENPGEKQFDYLDFDSYSAQDIEESKLYNKLNSIKCSGGGDFAEDIRGAILESVKVMSWSGRQQYLVLIADAPAHGIKYNGSFGDNYPDAKTLDDALDLLIKKNIRLVILEISKYTKPMVQEIKSYYAAQGRDNFVETNELNAEKIEDIAAQLSKCLCDTIKRNIDRDTIKKKYI